MTTAANDALTLNVTVPAGIEASARDGNLTLTGTARMTWSRPASNTAR